MRQVEDYMGLVTQERAIAEMLDTLDDRDQVDADMADDFKDRALRWVELATGWMAVFVNESIAEYGVNIPCCLWYLHGCHWTAVNNPRAIHLVGGSSPF